MAHDNDNERDQRWVTLYDDEVLRLMQGWTGGQNDPLYAISSMGGANYAWVFEDAIANIDMDLARVKKISRNKYQLGKGTFTKKEIDELATIRNALAVALESETEQMVEGRASRGGRGDRTRGRAYAREQLEGQYFDDWVYDQMVEAEQMRKRDPESVIPLETKSDYRRVARNMLQQLSFDTKRDLFFNESKEFFDGFEAELQSPKVIEWLTDRVTEIDSELRGSVREAPPRRSGQRPSADDVDWGAWVERERARYAQRGWDPDDVDWDAEVRKERARVKRELGRRRAPSRGRRTAATRYPEPPRGPQHIVTPRSRARKMRRF
jgi:hypothetical protein